MHNFQPFPPQKPALSSLMQTTLMGMSDAINQLAQACYPNLPQSDRSVIIGVELIRLGAVIATSGSPLSGLHPKDIEAKVVKPLIDQLHQKFDEGFCNHITTN